MPTCPDCGKEILISPSTVHLCITKNKRRKAEALKDRAPSGPLDLLVSGDLTEVKAKYNELIMAVANKFPGETRHETALRYIRQAETCSDQTCAASSD